MSGKSKIIPPNVLITNGLSGTPTPKNRAQHCLLKRGCQLAFLKTRGFSPLGPSSRPPPPTPEIWIGGTGRLLPPCRRPPPLSSSLAPALRLLPAVPALLRSPALDLSLQHPPAAAARLHLPAAPVGNRAGLLILPAVHAGRRCWPCHPPCCRSQAVPHQAPPTSPGAGSSLVL